MRAQIAAVARQVNAMHAYAFKDQDITQPFAIEEDAQGRVIGVRKKPPRPRPPRKDG